MAGNLPNEITLHVLEFVSPDDLINVALASSSMYHLATERLKEHRELQKEYRAVHMNINQGSNFLMQAYHNPRIWHYVKKLVYDSFRNGGHVDSVYLDIVESLLDSSPYMKFGDHLVTSGKEIIANMRSGSFDSPYNPWNGMFLALLFSYLPNVTTLRLLTRYPALQLHKSIINTIISANKQNPQLRALRKLSLIAIDGTTNMDSLTPLLFLPSLRTFEITNSYFDVPVEQPVGGQPSPLEEVKAFGSDVHRPQLLSILANLRKLVYHCEIETSTSAKEFRDILACLERSCSETLEELKFSTGLRLEVMNSSLGTFREFKKLKKLRFPASWVFRLEETDGEIDEYPESIRREALGLGNRFRPFVRRHQFKGVPRLVDILPPSLETVDIDVNGCPKTAVQFFEGLKELRHERLPNLRSIIIRCERSESMDGNLGSIIIRGASIDGNLLDHLKAIGASVGIEVKTKDM